MKKSVAMLVVLVSMSGHSVWALDFGKMFEDAVAKTAKRVVDDTVSDAGSAVRDAIPSLAKGEWSKHSEQTAIAGEEVILFETENCPYCVKARNFLKKNKVAYSSRDINNSASAKNEFNGLGGKGVPTILVGEERLTGWDEAKLRKMLKESGHM